MMFTAVAMALVLGRAPEDGPAELVARLGSPRFTDREAAAESLRRLGPPALPALRKARSVRDLETRIRASVLLDEIESGTLLQPTLVRLDFHDRPLSEVVKEIGRRAGVAIDSGDEQTISQRPLERFSWPDRRISLEAPEPLPLWKAIDRLCRAGGLRRLYPQQFHGFSEPFHRLVLATGTANPPKSDFGPFRVELLRICRQRDLDLTPGLSEFGRGPFFPGPDSRFAGPAFGPEIKEVRAVNFFAELLISTEPKLMIVGSVSLERLKATDPRGRSLLQEPTPEERKAQIEMFRMNPHIDPQLHPEVRFGSGYGSSSPSQLRWITLAVSTPPGGRMAELKGVAAVAVMARRADSLIIPLADAKGKSIANDGLRLTVHEAVVPPNHFYGELELTLESENVGETFKVQGPGIGPLEINRPGDLGQREIEILDNQDRTIEWSYLQPPKQGTKGRMRLQVRPRGQGERLDFSNLRVCAFVMVGAAMEVPFSFADVPMP